MRQSPARSAQQDRSGAPHAGTWRTGASRWPLGQLALIFLPAFALFALGALTDITLPGVYMDAVNPDYLIVRLLNPYHAQLADGGLPGTLLFGLFPLIGQVYHGALPNYVGLPFYAVFGTGVVGIRITNMVFGLIVLAGTGVFMRAFRVRTLICVLCLCLLALDPGFLFSFRTQFYITLLPVAALFASAALVEMSARAPRPAVALAAGLLVGIACYGYFIYVFLVPAVTLYTVLRWWRRPRAGRLALAWLGGAALGVLPYLAGYALLARAVGLHGLIGYAASDVQGGNAAGPGLPIAEALQVYAGFIRNSILGVGPSMMMFDFYIPLDLPMLKTALLLAVPAVALVSGLLRPRRVRGLLLLAGVLLGFLVLVTVFGRRMWLHHAALVLPVLYAALALALERLAMLVAPRRRLLAGIAIVVGLAPFLVANAADRQAFFLTLETTRGVGLSSDAIDRYAEDSLRIAPTAHRFFPDWGVSMPFEMLTRGTIPSSAGFAPSDARALLCAGQDVELVTTASQPAARLQDWIKAVGFPRYEQMHYDQPDGRAVLNVVLWHSADRAAGACP